MSIGNDLVYLADERSRDRYKEPRFVQKILTAKELSLVSGAQNKHTCLWFLWSLKEAAYKYCKRLHPALLFAPLRFEVLTVSDLSFSASLPGTLTGQLEERGFDHLHAVHATIETPVAFLTTRSVFTGEYVFSVACKDDAAFDHVHWGIKKIASIDYPAQSGAVRAFMADYMLMEKMILGNETFHFSKNKEQCPELYIKGDKYKAPFSFTHDHYFIGYALMQE